MTSKQMQNITRLIESAISNFNQTITFEKPVSAEIVRKCISGIMNTRPELFWFSQQYIYDEKSGLLTFRYNFTEKNACTIKSEIEKVVADDFQVDYVKTLSELERLEYVYVWIANRTTYNEFSSFNQSIYSVLINRNSVCAGYARTAQFLLGLVGIESKILFGKFHSDMSEYGRHAWNVVKIHGVWLHVDFCLADKSLKHLLIRDEKPVIRDSLLWNYFGVSTKTILDNLSIELEDSVPPCEHSLVHIPEVKLRPSKKRLICCRSASGTSSLVYLDSNNKSIVAKVPKEGHAEVIRNEAEILKILSPSVHVVKSYGIADDALFLEQLTPWGELLNSHYYDPSESDLTDILRQLTDGLREFRDKGVT